MAWSEDSERDHRDLSYTWTPPLSLLCLSPMEQLTVNYSPTNQSSCFF